MSLVQIYAEAVNSLTEMDPPQWCGENVRLFRSTDSAFYRPEFTPWFSDPLRETFDNRNKVISVTGPIGMGKSTFLEAGIACALDRAPGPMLVVGQTDSDANDWAETGLWPTLKNCEALRSMMPSARGTWRKDALMIPRSPIHITGANKSGTQSKSELYVWCDEGWLYDAGRIKDIMARLHRRWNGRGIFVSQAGTRVDDEDGNVIGDDFTRLHYQGEQREWCFSCPQCKSVQRYSIQQLQFPSDGTPAERAAQCVYECENCKTAWGDSSKDRRLLSSRSRYEVMRDARMRGHVSFHLNFIALFRSPWEDGVLQWIQANDSMKQGASLALEQFTQKELAEPWLESMTISRPNLDLFDGAIGDYANGEKIDGEAMRFMTVDVQRDHFWVMVRAWRGDGSSVLLHYSRVNSAETIEMIRKRMGVESHLVYIDSGYDSGQVYDYCVRWGWGAVKGDSVRSYRHTKTSGGKLIKFDRLISGVRRPLAPCGKKARLVHIAVDQVKDILARLRGGDGAQWQAVRDIGAEYEKQLDSEARETFLKKGTNQEEFKWVRKRRHNHAWDCEVYQTAAALIWRIFSE